MPHPILRLRDGYQDTSPELANEVRALQGLLNEQQFSVQADGLFGPGTALAVKDFQSAHGLEDDGIVGPATWAALEGEPSPEQQAFDFPTTLSPTHSGLLAELQAAEGFREYARAAAQRYTLPLCVLAGIASRESGWGLMLKPRGPGGSGDFFPRAPKPPIRTGTLPADGAGFGRGIMQIDYDSHPFARTGKWSDPAQNLMYGAGVVQQNILVLGPTRSWKGTELLQAALSGYNCGAGNVQRALAQGRDVDFFTSGRDYGRDTLNRAGWFRLKGWL